VMPGARGSRRSATIPPYAKTFIHSSKDWRRCED
jgi:hypothetical protein